MPAQRSSTRTTPTRANNKDSGNGFRDVDIVLVPVLDIEDLSEVFSLTACVRCGGLLPSGDKAQQAHRRLHEQIDGLDQRS